MRERSESCCTVHFLYSAIPQLFPESVLCSLFDGLYNQSSRKLQTSSGLHTESECAQMRLSFFAGPMLGVAAYNRVHM